MGIEGFSKKPETIRKAISVDDTEFLRRAGARGAAVTNEKRLLQADLAAAIAAHKAEQYAAEDEALRRASNEHIIDPDGTDFDWNIESDNQ